LPLRLKVEPELDERLLDEVHRQVEDYFRRNPPEPKVHPKVDDHELDRTLSDLERRLDRFGEHLGSKIGGHVGEIIPHITSGLGSMIEGMAGAETAAEAMGAAAGGAFIAISATAVAAGVAVFDVGEKFEEMYGKLETATGASGQRLEELKQSLDDIAASSPSSFEDITAALGQVNVTMHLTGQAADELVNKITEFQDITGQKVGIGELHEALAAFNVDLTQAADKFSELEVVSRDTATPLNELDSILTQVGGATHDMGLNFDQTLGLLERFKEAGVPMDRIAQGLVHANEEFAKLVEHGKLSADEMKHGFEDTLTQMQAFIRAGDDAAALDLGRKIFGAQAGEKFFDLLKNSKTDVRELVSGVQGLEDPVHRATSASEQLRDKWKEVTHEIETQIDKIGGPLVDAIEKAAKAALDYLFPDVSGIQHVNAPSTGRDPTSLLLPPTPGQPGTNAPWDASRFQLDEHGNVKMDAQGNPILKPAPAAPDQHQPADIAGAAADDAKKGRRDSAAIPLPSDYATPHPGESDEDFKHRQQLQRAQNELQTAQAKLDQDQKDNTHTENDIVRDRNAIAEAEARVYNLEHENVKKRQQNVEVAYPSGYGAPPRPGEGPEQYQKEQSYLSAVHDRQQAEARLAQTQSDAAHTQDDVVKATNTLTQARSRENEALLRLNESSKKASDNADDLGAKIDADFGISKGLPGIVENLTKFIGDLIAAPALVQMDAQRKLGGDTHGASGLIGAAVRPPVRARRHEHQRRRIQPRRRRHPGRRHPGRRHPSRRRISWGRCAVVSCPRRPVLAEAGRRRPHQGAW
jgi:hypothetical protein